MENKDFEMTEIKPKEQKIKKWKIKVPYNKLEKDKSYLVQMWTNNHTPTYGRVPKGHTHKAIANKFIGLEAMESGSFQQKIPDTTGLIPDDAQVAIFKSLKPIPENKNICDLCVAVEQNGWLKDASGNVALYDIVGPDRFGREFGFNFYPYKALQIKATHVFKSKKKNKTVYKAFPFEVKEQQDQKPNAPVHKLSTVLSRFQTYGGRKRRTRRRKIKKRKRKTNKRKSRKKRKTRRRKRSK
tara:strand:+ start:96 stop:818 length:723 start_codon:yes stop_codon:yes gene_type:complete